MFQMLIVPLSNLKSELVLLLLLLLCHNFYISLYTIHTQYTTVQYSVLYSTVQYRLEVWSLPAHTCKVMWLQWWAARLGHMAIATTYPCMCVQAGTTPPAYTVLYCRVHCTVL